jgi:N-acetyl-gamma-glutamyl-phosphate reductase
MRVGILNATGYAGGELLRFVAGHPDFDLCGVTARSQAGALLSDVWPWVRATARPAYGDLRLAEELDGSFDLVVSCLPHNASAAGLEPFLAGGVPAVDVSADYRFKDLAVYQRWYGPHPSPQWIERAVYGLTEYHRDDLRRTKLVANPGCHAVIAELALAPALRAGLVEPSVVVDSKTGISGAGRTNGPEFGYSEINESVNAYNVGAHRHGPEIAQELAELAGEPVQITFVPHLVPMTRGIFVTAYGRLRAGATAAAVKDAYLDAYADEPFVHVVDEPPHTKWTSGSNHAFVCGKVDEDNHMLVAMAVADNLGKGAAGAAVQNANVMLGLDERAGLNVPASFP